MSDQMPDNLAEVGNIHISVVMGEEGLATAFTIDNVSREAAIGHLTIVLDRLRQGASLTWHSDEGPQCPYCGTDFDEEED